AAEDIGKSKQATTTKTPRKVFIVLLFRLAFRKVGGGPEWRAFRRKCTGCGFRLMNISGHGPQTTWSGRTPSLKNVGRPSGLAENCLLEPSPESLTSRGNTVHNGSLH